MPIRIDVYSDFVCPWCFVGTRRLESVLREVGGRAVELRYHPYVLHPDAPREGIDLPAMLSRKYGVEPRRLFERVEAAARESGIPLDLAAQPRTYATFGAHTLMRHADAGRAQRELAGAIFSAYFLEARNIADPDVLGDVASPHGFSPARTERLLNDAEELEITREQARAAALGGIRGVPHFVVDGRDTLSGAQPVDVFRRAVARSAGG